MIESQAIIYCGYKINFVEKSFIIAKDRRLQETIITIRAVLFLGSQKAKGPKLILHCILLLVQRAESRYQNRVSMLKAYPDIW